MELIQFPDIGESSDSGSGGCEQWVEYIATSYIYVNNSMYMYNIRFKSYSKLLCAYKCSDLYII